jgi:hypothetical protein
VTPTQRRYNLSFVDTGGVAIASNASKIMDSISKGSQLRPIQLRRKVQTKRLVPQDFQNELLRSLGQQRGRRGVSLRQ